MTPVLPPELWDEIIDHLYDDKLTLCKCSLVCRLWLWFSRSHLFSTLVLKPFDNTALAILCAPGSTIPPHVRNLEMEDSVEMEDSDYQRWQDSQWLSGALSRLTSLNAVERLSISFVDWDFLTHEAKDRLFTMSHGLKSLTLAGIDFDTLDQALRLISSAPCLEYLSIINTDFRSEDAPLTEFSAPPIKHIMFGWHAYHPVIIDWLSHWHPTPSVYNLTFDGINVADIPSISMYIRRLGPVLEHLELACSDFANRGEIQAALRKEIDLTRNTSLKTISIECFIRRHDSPGSRTCDWLIDILSQITSPFIERVTLGVLLDTLQALLPLNLPGLATLFAERNGTFSERSTKLQFTIYGAADRTEARAAIAQSLRELDSQGRLEFGGHPIGMART